MISVFNHNYTATVPKDLKFDNEISQKENLNANTHLWIQSNGTVYKQYAIYNEVTDKNISNLTKIMKIKSLKHIPELSLPLAVYSNSDGKVDGYLMEYHNMHPLSHYIDERNHMVVLKAFQQLSDVIDKLPKTVYIGDLHAGNVLVGQESIRLIDIDGFSLKYGHKISCPLDAFSGHSIFYQRKYCDRMGNFYISRDSDICCVLWLFLSYLMETNPFDYTEDELRHYFLFLKDLGLPQDLYKMVNCMMSPKRNYLIPSVFEKVPMQMLDCCSYKEYVRCSCNSI